MSMPIFLNHCSYDHMPNGSQNEWQHFYQNQVFELQGDADFPLLWNLLFSQNDLKQAKYIDLFDIDDQLSTEDREEYFDVYGDETYPYFIVSQSQGLKNLALRKQAFLDIFGHELIGIYEQFQAVIETYYSEYIPIRTHEISLAVDAEEYFRTNAAAYENLAQPNPIQDQAYWQKVKEEMQKYFVLSYFLHGTTYAPQISDPFVYIENPNFLPHKTVYKDFSEFTYWIFGIVIALPSVFIWFKTHSLFWSITVFALLASLFSYIAIRYSQQKK